MKDELFIHVYCPKCRREEIETLVDGSLYCRYCDHHIKGVKVIQNKPDIEEGL